MKILLTGAEGFIGSHVLEELVSRGHQVTAVAQYNSFNHRGWLDTVQPVQGSDFQVMMGDVRDSGFVHDAVRGHSHVIHLAALIAIPYSYAAPRSYIETNVLGTLNVLDACRRHDVKRLVQTSTSEVYGSAQFVPINEQHPLAGQSPYSASKIGADHLAQSYWASYSTPVVILRPFNSYGPRQSQRAFIPSVISQLLSGAATLSVGAINTTRDLTFVADTARGFADVVESERGLGEVFNMGSGFEVSMGQVIEELFAISGLQLEVVTDAQRLRPEASEVDRLWSDSARMLKTFGWSPTHKGRDGLRRGLASTFEWFETSGNVARTPRIFVV